MINQHSLLASEILAKTLADRKIAVVSKGDTYLANLTGLSDITKVIESDRDLSVNEKIGLLYDNPLFDGALALLVKNVNYANNSILAVAKNNVIPLVNFMADRYSSYIANAQSIAVLPLNVEVVAEDTFWDNDLFREAISTLPSDFTDAVKLSITFPKKDRSELELMAKTGFARYDNLLAESLTRYEASAKIDVYEDVWNSIFARDGQRNLSTVDAYYKGNEDVIQYHLPVLWAILRYLSNESNIPSGIICSIIDYREFVSNALASINTMLNFYLGSYDKHVKAKRLVISFPSTLVDGKRQQVIRVKQRLYDEFLKEGGSVDAILGAAISDRADTVTGLLEGKDAYEANWREHYALINSTVTSEIREIKRTGIKRALIEASQEYDKQQLALTNPDVNPATDPITYRYEYFADLPEDIREFIEALDEHKLSEINYISQQLICDLLFDDTDVYKILDLINEYGKKDPEASAKTALTLAITDYIVNWSVDQLDFVQQ